MTINNCSKVRNLIPAAFLITSLCLANHASAQETSFFETRSFLVDLNTRTVTPFDTLTLGSQSMAFDINDAGQVVGASNTTEGTNHAFITDPDGVGMRNLGTLGGRISNANGINDTGQVVGHSLTAEGVFHAFITDPDGMDMRDLGALPGHHGSIALDLNDAGQVVGASFTAEGAHHAFITGPDGMGMTDLNSLVDLPEGVILLTQALGINNNGQVIAWGNVPALMIPEPENYALMLAGLGLVGFMTRRRKTEGLGNSRA